MFDQALTALNTLKDEHRAAHDAIRGLVTIGDFRRADFDHAAMLVAIERREKASKALRSFNPWPLVARR